MFSGSVETNALFNLINNKPDIDKFYLQAKDPQLLSKAFIEYLNYIDEIYKNIEEYNLNKKQKILILFDDMIAVCLVIKKII